MLNYNAPLADMSFLLNDLGMLSTVANLPGYREVDSELLNVLLTEANKLASEILAPINRSGDKEGVSFQNGIVRTADGFRQAYKTYIDNGWNGLTCNTNYGGQQMPLLIGTAVMEMFASANMSWSLCPLLTVGAIESLELYGSDKLKMTYLPKLISGEWTGTMNLTEPHAGSDLSALSCRARRENGYYRICGQKIYITFGEHDMAENIIHMVLARLPDAPSGTKGISLFLVPKVLVDETGTLGQKNDLRCASVEKKLGIHASPTCVMSYGENKGAIGYLVGEENEGLKAMFTMMNLARFNIGLQGVSISERAYQQARNFARERIQGRLGGGENENVAIIKHPDVRRMLINIKSQTEAMRALAYDTAVQFDISKQHPDEIIKKKARSRLDLLTPVVKGWSTDLGVELASMALQIHGGMGFIEETGAAQHYRDSRIAPIYEGTNGIQAKDLVGRKILRDRGETAKLYFSEMYNISRDVSQQETNCYRLASILKSAVDAVSEATDWLVENGDQNPALAFAGASTYLNLFGKVAGGAMMVRSAGVAAKALLNNCNNRDFYKTKLVTAQYYTEHILTLSKSLAGSITNGSTSILALDDEAF